jgi:hypothetical protein
LIPEQFLSQLTPTQRASLFPKYFSEALPDVSGFRSATGGAAPTTSPTGTATEAPVSRPSGTSQPTVASQNQQAQQAEQAQQGLAGILAPYMPQQAATRQKEEGKVGLKKDSKLIESSHVRLRNRMGIDNRQYNAFREAMVSIESHGGNYGIMGGSAKRVRGGRFAGAYQIGGQEIIEISRILGIKPPIKYVNGVAVGNEEFLSNPDLQEKIFDAYTERNHKTLMKSKRYASMSKDEQLQVLGYAHNQGAGGALKWLKTGRAGKDAFGTAGTKYYNTIGRYLQESASQAASTPTAQEFQEATAQPASKNVFKLDKEKLREAAKKSNLLAGLASDEKIDSEINKKIQSLLPEGASYNPETGEITGNLSIDDIKSIVKEKAPEFGDQVSQYIQPVGQPLVPSAQDELAAQAVPTVAMSDEVKTFISELPEQARNELSNDPAKANAVAAAIKAGEGDRIKNEITQLYSQKDKPTATEVKNVVTPGKGDPRDQWGLQEARDIKGVDPRLVHILEEASKDFPLRVRLFSGKEGRSKGVHSTGKASDIMIHDEAGNPIGAYGTPETANIYAMFAEKARQKQQELYPELNDKFVWGGSFSGMSKKSGVGGKYGGGDWMDFRIAGAVGTNEMKAYKFGEGWQKGYEYYASGDFLGIGAKQGQFTQEDYEKLSGLRLSEEQLARQRRIAERGGYNAGLLGHKGIGERQYPTQTVASSQQVQAQTQTQPASTDTSGNIIPQAGGTPTPEQAAAQAQATATEAPPKEEKGMIQKAWDWVTGSDNSSEAPLAYGADIEVDQRNPARLIDSMGNEKVIGEAGAEKISVESKYNPQDQNQTLAKPVEPASKNAMDLSQQQPFSDWSQTTLGSHNPTSSMKDAFNYAKFSKGGWSERLYLNGSKNVV